MAQRVNNPPAMQETQKTPRFDPWVGKIPQEEEMATHSSILAWKIPWTDPALAFGGLYVLSNLSFLS